MSDPPSQAGADPSPRTDHLLLRALDRAAASRGRRAEALAVASIVLIGWVDWVSGAELAFSAFYLLPVFLVSAAHPRLALPASLLAATTWLLADAYARGEGYTSIVVPLWNTTARFATFAVVGYLVVVLRRTLDNERALSRTDLLSGLPNSRAFYDAAAAELHRAGRTAAPLSAAYIDVDDFKAVNDRFGHAEGDDLIAVLGRLLAERCRASDTAARLGGDEFGILLPASDAAGATTVLDDIRVAFAAEAARRGWPAGLSVGIVEFRTPPATVDELVSAADALMYRVKQTGKNAALSSVVGTPSASRP